MGIIVGITTTGAGVGRGVTIRTIVIGISRSRTASRAPDAKLPFAKAIAQTSTATACSASDKRTAGRSNGVDAGVTAPTAYAIARGATFSRHRLVATAASATPERNARTVGQATEIVLYQAEWCPYCVRVRKKMTDLLLDYKLVNVPHEKSERREVIAVSGQSGIPVMVDGDVVLDDDDDIIPYLEKKFGKK
jgi:glutaredoxin